MSKKSFGFKLQLGFNNAKTTMSLLNLFTFELSRALERGDITPEHKFAGIEITDNQDYSYSVMFNFDDEISVEEIFNKAITGENQ